MVDAGKDRGGGAEAGAVRALAQLQAVVEQSQPHFAVGADAHAQHVGTARHDRRLEGASTAGSYTTIAFTLDGREAITRFGSPLSPAITDALLADGQSEPLTVPALKSKPAGATFFCTR